MYIHTRRTPPHLSSNKTNPNTHTYTHTQTHLFPQAFTQRINDRSCPELYYGSVQWALYLLFALLILTRWTSPLTRLCDGIMGGRWRFGGRRQPPPPPLKTTTETAGTTLFLLALALLLLPLLGRHLALSPRWFQGRQAHPLRFAPYVLMGVMAADGLRCVYVF